MAFRPTDGNPSLAALEALQRLDAREFVRLQRELDGEFEIGCLSRLVEGLPAQQPGRVRWRLNGQSGPAGQQRLRLRLWAEPQVECQRCLQAYGHPIETEVLLELVASEAELEADDPLLEAELAAHDGLTIEKVLCSGRLDVLAQIEDELILSLPYIARHEVCPEPLVVDATATPVTSAAVAETRRSLAGLADLKAVLRRRSDKPS